MSPEKNKRLSEAYRYFKINKLLRAGLFDWIYLVQNIITKISMKALFLAYSIIDDYILKKYQNEREKMKTQGTLIEVIGDNNRG